MDLFAEHDTPLFCRAFIRWTGEANDSTREEIFRLADRLGADCRSRPARLTIFLPLNVSLDLSGLEDGICIARSIREDDTLSGQFVEKTVLEGSNEVIQGLQQRLLSDAPGLGVPLDTGCIVNYSPACFIITNTVVCGDVLGQIAAFAQNHCGTAITCDIQDRNHIWRTIELAKNTVSELYVYLDEEEFRNIRGDEHEHITRRGR